MSHEISNVSGRNEMFYVGEKPWHGLGVSVEKHARAAEAISLAGLDWDVYQRPLFMPDQVKVPDRVANVRLDKDKKDFYLGTVGTTYKLIQNRDAFTFFDEVVGQGQAIYHTAGAIKDGRRVWILAKLHEPIRDNRERKLIWKT